jgi:hypothetical protein
MSRRPDFKSDFARHASRAMLTAAHWSGRPTSPLTFLLIALAVPIFFCLASAGIVFSGIPLSNNQLILNYQLEKIDAAPRDLRTIIIGDSSAGNAIDAAEFQRLTGEQTINLALTGSFGLLNNLLLAQHAIERLGQVEKIVFVVAAENWGRSFAAEGYYLIASSILGLRSNHIEYLPEEADAQSKMFGWLIAPKRISWLLSDLISQEEKKWSLEDDYLSQRPPIDSPPKRWHRRIRPVEDEQLLRLKKEIEVLCSRNKVGCYVMVGPLFDGRAARSGEALARLREHFERFNCSSHVRWNGAVLSLPFEYFGDSSSHVHPSRKKEITGVYATRYVRLREIGQPACNPA